MAALRGRYGNRNEIWKTQLMQGSNKLRQLLQATGQHVLDRICKDKCHIAQVVQLKI